MHTGIRTIRHRTPAQWTALILCAITVLAAAVIIFLRCNDIILMGDDLFYAFMLDDQPVGSTPDVGPRIQSVADAISSQSHQYFGSNGRFMVHVITQWLAGHHPAPYFAIFNAVLFAAYIILLVHVCIPRHKRSNPLWWVCAMIAGLYLFPLPYMLWYTISMSMNYLLPTCLTLGFLYSLRSIRHRVWASVMLGFLTGCSHESFALPISGAMAAYCWLMRRNLPRHILWSAIALWIGTIIVLIAPGNFHRVGGGLSMGGIWIGIVLLYKLPMLWAFIITCIIVKIRGRGIMRQTLRENPIVTSALILAVPFAVLIHTSAQTYTAITLFCCILMFSMLSKITCPIVNTRGRQNLVAAVVLTALICHQTAIIETQTDVNNRGRRILSLYMKHPDSILVYQEATIPGITAPWVFRHIVRPHSSVAEYYKASINSVYFRGSHPLNLLCATEFDEMRHPDRYSVNSRLIPGSAGIHMGDKWMWAQYADTIYVTVRRPCRSLSARVMRIINPGEYMPAVRKMTPDTSIHYPDGRIFVAYPNPRAEIVRVDRRSR